MRPQPRTILGIATVTVSAVLVPAAGLGSAAVAGEGRPVVKVVQPIDEQFFYGNDTYLAFAGPPIDAKSCGGEYPPVKTFYRQRQDGTWTERWGATLTLTLYETTDPGPVFLPEQCDAILEDGQPPPEPFATGQGEVRSYISAVDSPSDRAPLPGAHIVNRSFGFVVDDEGQRYRVKAQADLVLDENRVPIGSPADFQGLSVKPVGSSGH